MCKPSAYLENRCLIVLALGQLKQGDQELRDRPSSVSNNECLNGILAVRKHLSPVSGMSFAAPVQTCTDWHAVDSQANFPIVHPTERANGTA